MKLIKVNNRFSSYLLRIYKEELLALIETYDVSGALDEIKSEIPIEDVYSSVNSLYVSGGYICMPDNCRTSYILRLLQYGGPHIKALNLLTLSSVKLGGSL